MWRVNGITAGVLSNPEGPGPEYLVRRELAAFSRYKQDRSPDVQCEPICWRLVPATTTVVYNAPAETKKPRLHVLAIGIDQLLVRAVRPLSLL